MRAVVLLGLLLCFTPALSATVLLPAEFREIVSGSHIIVYGRVVDVRAEWAPDRRQIESVVTVEPSSFMRGTPVETISFRVPGGQIGRYKSVTIGAPEFRTGEEAVLFLTASGPSMPQVFGLNQGVFRVRVDSRTGQRTVALPALMARSDAAERVVRGAPERRPLPLDQFTAQVQTVLRQGGVR
ncbi:MAG TPA: hypothetical protein VM364_10970 [Vicinamibacterales bacterium]|nr:hypothetical protein [Vicinamibacterales bacterium]